MISWIIKIAIIAIIIVIVVTVKQHIKQIRNDEELTEQEKMYKAITDLAYINNWNDNYRRYRKVINYIWYIKFIT